MLFAREFSLVFDLPGLVGDRDEAGSISERCRRASLGLLLRPRCDWAFGWGIAEASARWRNDSNPIVLVFDSVRFGWSEMGSPADGPAEGFSFPACLAGAGLTTVPGFDGVFPATAVFREDAIGVV